MPLSIYICASHPSWKCTNFNSDNQLFPYNTCLGQKTLTMPLSIYLYATNVKNPHPLIYTQKLITPLIIYIHPSKYDKCHSPLIYTPQNLTNVILHWSAHLSSQTKQQALDSTNQKQTQCQIMIQTTDTLQITAAAWLRKTKAKDTMEIRKFSLPAETVFLGFKNNAVVRRM